MDFKIKKVGGVCVNGCLPATRDVRLAEAALIESAESIEFAGLAGGEMPVVRWDSAFESWLDERIALADRLTENGVCLLPWVILQNLPKKQKQSEILTWFQNGHPSCTLHGFTHSFQDSLLRSIALGSPLVYESFLPILTFWLCCGKSLAAGQTIYAAAKWINERGLFPTRLVGTDNVRVPSGWENYEEDAKRWQAGIVFIEGDIVEKLLLCCHALLDVTYGSSVFPTSSKIDENGVKIAAGWGHGPHCTKIGNYRVVNGKVYVGLRNSHGNQFPTSPEGEPATDVWLTVDQLRYLLASAKNFGSPAVVFPEGEIRPDRRFVSDFGLPFPEEWRS